MLKIDHLYAGYGAFEVLFDLSLTVNEGEWVSLIGTNGAGKTTLLNTIARLHDPAQGKIVFDGIDITSYQSHQIGKLHLSYMAEGHPIFNHLTVKENLELGGIAAKLPFKKQQEKIKEIYSLFPLLEERSKQRAGTFSGGEQQLLTLARCLMGSPKLILCDEPTLGLSPLRVKELFKILKTLHQQGTALLLVEQNVEQALSFCDKAYILEQGVIKLTGTGAEILRNPEVKKVYLGYE